MKRIDSQHKTLVFNPYAGINWETVGRHKANLHAHTLFHSPPNDGFYWPDQVIKAYQDGGYDIIAITEHNMYIWPWSDYENHPEHSGLVTPEGDFDVNADGVHTNGMMSFRSNELSSGAHVLGYDMDHEATFTSDMISKLDAVSGANGIFVFAHPGRYPTQPQEYIEWIKAYSNVSGFEVINHADRHGKPENCAHGLSSDRHLWDKVLESLMPGRPVFGYANDDLHNPSGLYRSFNYFLLDSFTKDDWRNAMMTGRSFFCYEVGQSGTPLVPIINSISVDAAQKTITIDADDYTSIQWISMGNTVGTNETINYDADNIGNYVRALIRNEHGDIYTQPFGFMSPSNVIMRAGNELLSLQPIIRQDSELKNLDVIFR